MAQQQSVGGREEDRILHRGLYTLHGGRGSVESRTKDGLASRRAGRRNLFM